MVSALSHHMVSEVGWLAVKRMRDPPARLPPARGIPEMGEALVCGAQWDGLEVRKYGWRMRVGRLCA